MDDVFGISPMMWFFLLFRDESAESPSKHPSKLRDYVYILPRKLGITGMEGGEGGGDSGGTPRRREGLTFVQILPSLPMFCSLKKGLSSPTNKSNELFL